MEDKRQEMIERQLIRRGIYNERVLKAMQETDRAQFVPLEYQAEAYADRPLPIGEGQTISQPYIVAYMAQVLSPKPEDKVLEVGTGCGYNAAVLSRLVKEVYSLEIIDWLAELAKENLNPQEYPNIHTRQGDGYAGWPEAVPFDAIILTAAPPAIPEPLKQQLAIGGKLVAPVGTNRQGLVLLEKKGENEFRKKTLLMVSFVPMTGKAQQ